MLLCGIWALNSWRQMSTVALAAAAPGAPAVKRRSRRSRRRPGTPRASFGERLDERWRRRQEGGR
jgi:hypothetical protein